MRLITSHGNRATQKVCVSLSVLSILIALSTLGTRPGFTADSGSDTTAPVVTITAPTKSPTYSTSGDTLTLRGTAADNVGVTQVTCSTDRGINCPTAGTLNWTAEVTGLQIGANVVVVS